MKKLIIFYLLFFLTGCTSINLKKEKSEETIISLSIFANQEEQKKANPGPYGVLSEIYYLKDKKWEKLKTTMVPSYSLIGVKEGKYLLRVEKYISKEGHIEDIKGKKEKIFKIRDGERVNINVILKAPPPTTLLIIGVLAGVAVIWALYEILKEGELPRPFPPPIEISPLLQDFLFHISLNYPNYYSYEKVDKIPPKLIANYPLHKDPAVSRDTHIFLNFSEPIKENWDEDTFQILGEKSGVVKGKIFFNSTKDMVEFMPSTKFLSNEIIYVTLNGDNVEDLASNKMGDKVTFYFITK